MSLRGCSILCLVGIILWLGPVVDGSERKFEISRTFEGSLVTKSPTDKLPTYLGLQIVACDLINAFSFWFVHDITDCDKALVAELASNLEQKRITAEEAIDYLGNISYFVIMVESALIMLQISSVPVIVYWMWIFEQHLNEPQLV